MTKIRILLPNVGAFILGFFLMDIFYRDLLHISNHKYNQLPIERTAFDKPTIACLVHASPTQNVHLNVIRNTWGSRCDFFWTYDKTISDYENLKKIYSMLQDTDYVFVTTAESYVIVENLKYSVLNQNTDDHFFSTCTRETDNNEIGLLSMPCTLLSRGAVQMLLDKPTICDKTNNLAMCLISAGIEQFETRDHQQHNLLDVNKFKKCFGNFLHGEISEKAAICLDPSSSPLSHYQAVFQNMSVNNMRVLEYLLYFFELGSET